MKFADLRRRAGLTQKEVADKIGVSRSTVAMWETGDGRPRGNQMFELTLILGCEVSDLLDMQGEMKNEEDVERERYLTAEQERVLSLTKKLSDENVTRLINYAELLFSVEAVGELMTIHEKQLNEQTAALAIPILDELLEMKEYAKP